jgi:PadR family transcriptional regulator, regulatory protein PadR
MADRQPVWQGTLALMVLRTLETLGPTHGYGIARRIEQTSEGRLILNYGTIYPMLLKLEQEGFISAKWGVSDNNRKARYYALTRGAANGWSARPRTGHRQRISWRNFSRWAVHEAPSRVAHPARNTNGSRP